MTEKESKKFKMPMDDETLEFQVQEDLDDLKVEKLHKRITRISIIIPCLVVIIILAAYFDLKKNLSSVNTKGDMGVETLSKELESRFSSLSIKEANIEETLGKKIAALEKATSSLQTATKEATTAIKYIRSARKKDNENTASAIKKIEKTLASIPKDLEKISSDLKAINKTSSAKLVIFSQFMDSSENDLQTIRSDISSLKSSKVDRTALKDQQKVYQLALRQLTTNLEDRIKSIENMLKVQAKVNAPVKKQSQTKPEKSMSSNQTKTTSVPSSSSSKETDISKPDSIVEQDLSPKNPE
jgi:DNA repair exonuclease SbcCD ATPase subunit